MTKSRFYIVDVFAEKKYAGNQLAVVRDTATLAESDFQTIAKEMNYSETTFLGSEEPRDNGYDVRIFTPEHELPFAGHPTLGTAFVIQQEIIGKPVEQVNLNLKVGQIPVTFSYRGQQPDLLWMKQVPPIFGEILEPVAVAPTLGLAEDDIDGRFPVQLVSTGAPFIIVPLKSQATLKLARTDVPRFFKLVDNLDAKAALVFCPETTDPANDLSVRVFVDYYGIPEDPATGSANGCLAGYLARHRYFGDSSLDIRVEQGLEIGRPSLLYLRAEDKGDEVDVHVGGRVVMVAAGELL